MRTKIARLSSITAMVVLSLVMFLQTAAWGGTFATAAPMNTPRGMHTSTTLQNGQVLVTGGYDGSNFLASAELYDPATNSWAITGSMSMARSSHRATLLLDGKVLVTGGYDGIGYLASAELYDPETGSWSSAGSMSTARFGNTSTLLPNGKVLVAGGYTGIAFLSTSELYDPATNSWSTAGSMSVQRLAHTATQLQNGNVLVTGGCNGTDYRATAEQYDPTTDSWSTAGVMSAERAAHTATLLPNGKVLVTGGYKYTTTGIYLASADLYDPATNSWTTAATMSAKRGNHSATLLANGTVLVAGSQDSNYSITTELYDPTTNKWVTVENMREGRYDHTATLLATGGVLISGGKSSTSNSYLASTELYDPKPIANISGTPASPIKAGTYQLSVSGDWVSAFKWRLNSGTWSEEAPVSAMISVAANTDGLYKVEAIGRDSAGNWQNEASPSSVSWTVDATPPVPGLLWINGGASSTNNTTVSLTISATDVGSGLAGMQVSEDSNFAGVAWEDYATTKPFTLSAANGLKYVFVRFKDKVGNISEAASAPITLDTIAPSLTIDSPATAVTIINNSTMVISGTKEAGSHLTANGPAGVIFAFSDSSTDVATSWSCTVSGYPANQPNEATNISITTSDTAGNSTTKNTSISYITTAYAVISGTPASPIKAGTYTLSVNGYLVTAYKWRVNGGKWSKAIPVAKTFRVKATSAKAYIVEVIASDASGVWQIIPSTATWTVDTVKPNTLAAVNAPPESSYNITSYSFESSEAGGTFECKIDSGVYTACTSPYSIPPLKDGKHKLTIRAKDIAGNYDSSPLVYRWIVKTVTP